MRNLFAVSLLLLTCLACSNKNPENPESANQATAIDSTFDREKWRVKEREGYVYRDLMLHDIVYNDTIRSLRKDEFIAMLGEPDRVNEGHLYYTIKRTQLGSWTLHTKTMVVKLTENDGIEWIKIHE